MRNKHSASLDSGTTLLQYSKAHLVAVATLLLAAVDGPGVQAGVASADKWKNVRVMC